MVRTFAISFITFFLYSFVSFASIQFTKLTDQLQSPWSLTSLGKDRYVITEKSGKFILFDKVNNRKTIIEHNLNILEDGQGGLMDVLYHDNYLYVSYSENRGSGKSSTSAARAVFNEQKLNFTNLFRAEPPIASGYHFGSRLVIQNTYLFISAGERGGDSIGQEIGRAHV